MLLLLLQPLGIASISVETTVHYSTTRYSEAVESAFYKGRGARQLANFQKKLKKTCKSQKKCLPLSERTFAEISKERKMRTSKKIVIHQAIEKLFKFRLKLACDGRAAQRSNVRIAQELVKTFIGVWTSVLLLSISL